MVDEQTQQSSTIKLRGIQMESQQKKFPTLTYAVCIHMSTNMDYILSGILK